MKAPSTACKLPDVWPDGLPGRFLKAENPSLLMSWNFSADAKPALWVAFDTSSVYRKSVLSGGRKGADRTLTITPERI